MKTPFLFLPVLFSLTLFPVLCASGSELDAELPESGAPDAEQTATPPERDENSNWIDSTRDWLYRTSHGGVEWLDTSMLDEDQERVPTPPSRFRLGLFTEIELKPEGTTSFAPVADFDTDVDLPNLEARLKLFISTRDPTAIPGDDPLDSESALRVGASRSFFDNWKTSAGIKTKWVPEPFFYLQWSPEYALGEKWTVVPQIRPFWESEDGFGGITSLVMNRWNRRMIFRQSFSLKWSQKFQEDDRKSAADEDHPQFGDDGKGYRWDSTSILGYVPLLLDERDYGRRVGGSDVAKGTGIKFRVSGNQIKTLEGRITLFNKGPIYKDFLYYIVGPEVIWQDDQNWKEEYAIKAGFEMLLWGDDPYR
ncbi:MAG: hypothetical protein ACO3N7_03930 [Kiritimatiellia bacterium]